MAVNVTKKVNVAANQRFDKADFDAWQDYFEAMVARLGAIIGAPLIDTNNWLVDGTLVASSITTSGADLTVVAGCEFMLPSGHIVALADDKVFTGVLPLASASSLMVRVSAADVEDVASADDRRFWSSASTAEYLNTTNTIKQKELDWVIVPTADLHTYIGAGYTRVAALTTAGVATWQYFFPFSDTYELKSIMGIVKRLIGDNENSGSISASNGGLGNINSGMRAASSGGMINVNSANNTYSGGGEFNTNSGEDSASLGGRSNINSGMKSGSVAGATNENSGEDSASNGGLDNENSGEESASNGGLGNENSGIGSASNGGSINQNIGRDGVSNGGSGNINQGDFSASNGGTLNHNSGEESASNGGRSNANSGVRSASSGGYLNHNSGQDAASMAAMQTWNSGERACVIGGQFYELADDYCFAIGYDTSLTPSGANQNLSHYFNAQTGEVRHLGNFKVGGNVNDGTGAKVVITASSGDIHTQGDLQVNSKIKNAAGADVVFDDSLLAEAAIKATTDVRHLGGHHVALAEADGGISVNVDWSSSAETHTAASGITLADKPINSFGVTIGNTDGSSHDIAIGQSILVPVTIPSGLRVMSGWVSVVSGTMSASMQASRWTVSSYYGSASGDHIALTQIGETAASIGASDLAGLSVRLHVVKEISAL